MTKEFKTEQENFWAGEFGTEYIERNKSNNLLASNLNYFSKIFSDLKKIDSVIEFGANIGMNLRAIHQLLPDAELAGIEINKNATLELEKLPKVEAINASILDFNRKGKTWDFVLIKGVLIHINPDELKNVYHSMYNSSGRYICIGEYYNPSPVALSYRGHSNKLFKRDFAGEMMDLYPDLKLVKYGFCYRRDPQFPQDDISWFVLEK